MIDYESELQSRGLDLQRSGEDFVMTNCPFHDDHSPSFSVSLKTGSFRCFSCHVSGSFAELIAEIDHVPVAVALRRYRRERTSDDLLAEVEKSLDEAPEAVEYYSHRSFHRVFPSVIGTAGQAYLQSRGIDEVSAKRFDARWGTSGKWSGRVVLPIRMPGGEILSYVGRTIHSGQKPKTRKSRSPNRTLYGVYELTRRFSKPKYVVVVEGEFDAIYLQQHHVPAVARMGTADLTSYQISILRSMRATVVLSYDGDDAGREAVYGNGKSGRRRRPGALECLRGILPTVVVDLPDGRDPNDLTPPEVKKIYRNYLAQ